MCFESHFYVTQKVHMEEEELLKLMNKLDKNNDKKVSFEEYKEFMIQQLNE